MKVLARLSPALLALALLTAPSVWGQILTGKGFTADPNGYRSDEPALATERFAVGSVLKDCDVCPEMVVIPGGSFEMGSNNWRTTQPVHRVSVVGFLLGKTEVTQGQWKAVMGNNPSRFTECGDACPVEKIGWDDALEFVRRLSEKTGKQYRLPTEAEWEYAAKAGSGTKYGFGDDESLLNENAWFSSNSNKKTHPVAQKKSNAFGLYDMYGNVEEWTQDCWHENYVGAPTDGSAWTTPCTKRSYLWFSSIFRVVRGGSYLSSGPLLAFPGAYVQSSVIFPSLQGFRVARDL